MRFLAPILILLFSLSFSYGSGKKAPPMSITFHLESNPDPGKKLTFKANTLLGPKHFRRSPEIRTSHIAAFTSFASPHNQNEYGLILKLNRDGQTALNRFTTQHKGAHILAFLNGRPVDILRVDRTVSDGIICIWRGVSAAEIKMADTLVPRIGEDPKKWKARLKKQKKGK